MTPLQVLRESPLFASLDDETLEKLVSQSQIVTLRGGEPVYEANTLPDALYFLLSGRLRAERVEAGVRKPLRELGRGETLGGLSLLAEMPHRVKVVAIRDSQLLKIPPPVFERLMLRHPAFARRAVRGWLRIVLYGGEKARPARDVTSVRTIAVVPAHQGAPTEGVARALLSQLSAFGRSVRIDGRCLESDGRISECDLPADEAGALRWLDDRERSHRHVVYQASDLDSAWTQRCLRQADRIVMVVSSGLSPRPTLMTERLRAGGPTVEVAIMGSGATEAMAWRELSGASMHHRLAVGDEAGFARLARLLTGRALGLALGGGGARGFAHLGLLRAMRDLDMLPDIVIGASMGAFIGALHATGLPDADVASAVHGMFVARNVLNDYTVPTVSLIRGRKARRHLESLFGETRIEDLKGYYACVTTNLTRARIEVHDSGRLAHWVGASMSIPGIAPPVVYRGDLLVDGGVLMSVPSDVVAALGRGPVIACDVSADEQFRGLPDSADSPIQAPRLRRDPGETNIFQILHRTATMSPPEELKRRSERADLYVRMPVSGVAMFDWARFDEMVEGGYRHALDQLRRWRANPGQEL